ncbi:hypothetical protein VM98_25065 [Streptomyces rubellomurinus subsp. indigoferus]|uniref:TauD/TfdA-like domain-containing protein n=1 Tax=Streptomyces rubellomurinus (strain ATCC 31215) TaxID=359131 RepID=A0A0F2TKH3_STRR3|nr:TauD/TfdA family dioxygenase [Streptomyces rubellomurinus]KJS53467.1 hypothetical protein VM98_25065 [Streptomyces rubellomurinus subsp. indigoferus]KJS62222.1 hypothetical protein VM95_10205 [Streptomyces rubellomurinus]
MAKVDTFSPDQDPLTVPGNALGRRQLHPRGDEFGVIGTVTGTGDQAVNELSAAWRDLVDEYQAVGLKDVGCHTDGAFIDGPGVVPPALLLLHCAQPADTGGESVLVDVAALLETAQRADPALLRELLRPQFTFCRDELVAVYPPVFRQRTPAAVSVRWRFDKAVYGIERALAAARAFHDRYVLNAPRTEIRPWPTGQRIHVPTMPPTSTSPSLSVSTKVRCSCHWAPRSLRRRT